MKYHILLILTAAIWGCAFVAQVVAMDTMGPFWFNAVRFLLGSASLLPVIHFFPAETPAKPAPFPFWAASLLAGLFLFGGAALQQVGIVYTTASKASFITSLYILLVPILGLFLGHSFRRNHAIGTVLAMMGVYFLSMKGSFSIELGDFLVLVSAVFFSLHILLLAYLTERFAPVALSSGQFLVCAVLNGMAALAFGESFAAGMLLTAWWPILYGGLLSAGVAYTLQAVCQKHVPPGEASMILSTEMIFGALSGILFLGESLTMREWAGAALMVAGVFLSQIPSPVWIRGKGEGKNQL